MNMHSNTIAFLLSNPYSGATLLAFLLNNHNNLVCNGETFPDRYNNLESFTCSCGEKIFRCDFYKHCADHFFPIEDSIQNLKYFIIFPELSSNKFLNRLFTNLKLPYCSQSFFIKKIHSLRSLQNKYLKLHHDFIDKACRYYNKDIYIDNTKSIQRVNWFLDNGLKEPKAIHLVRDGRAFFCSYKRINAQTNLSDKSIARKWQVYIDEIDKLKARNKDFTILNVKLEDLCDDPVEVLKKICDFLNVDFDNNMHTSQKFEHHIQGNYMRFKFDWVIKKNSNAWKEKMTKKEIELCNRIQKRGLIKLGYL